MLNKRFALQESSQLHMSLLCQTDAMNGNRVTTISSATPVSLIVI